jgi:hypothetical protein
MRAAMDGASYFSGGSISPKIGARQNTLVMWQMNGATVTSKYHLCDKVPIPLCSCLSRKARYFHQTKSKAKKIHVLTLDRSGT